MPPWPAPPTWCAACWRMPASPFASPLNRVPQVREANLGLFRDLWNPRSQSRDLGHPGFVVIFWETADLSPLRCALSKIILGGVLCQRLWFPTLATQGWGTLDLLEVWIQNRHQSRVPHIWRALCARCGKPQISPLPSAALRSR